MPTAAANDFFTKKHTTSVAYLVGLLLFFLPFVQIKCNDMPFVENTGLGLAFGTGYKTTGNLAALPGGPDHKTQASIVSKEKGKLYVLALAALVLGVVGLGISLSKLPSGPLVSMVLAAVAAACLIALMFQINADVKGETGKPDRASDFSNVVRVSVSYTFWFYLSVCSFLAAAFFAYKHRQLLPEPSPAGAPQLDLQNPTDQTEFPRAPSESEIG